MPRSRYKTLVDAFAADIRSGMLPPGTRLPPHRQLAAQEGLALVTASRVYAELEAMGLISGETGRGTFVRETSLSPGQGIDQKQVAVGMIDLNFNYRRCPVRRICCAARCANWRCRATWKRCCVISRMPAVRMNARRSLGIC